MLPLTQKGQTRKDSLLLDRAAEAYAASKDSATGVVILGDAWSFYDTSEVFRATMHLTRVVFPTQQYVEHIHDNCSDWEQKIYEASVKFLDVCP
jgi:hypothetical protein